MAEQKGNQDKNKSRPENGSNNKQEQLRESVLDYAEKNINIVTNTAPAPKPKTDDTKK